MRGRRDEPAQERRAHQSVPRVDVTSAEGCVLLVCSRDCLDVPAAPDWGCYELGWIMLILGMFIGAVFMLFLMLVIGEIQSRQKPLKYKWKCGFCGTELKAVDQLHMHAMAWEHAQEPHDHPLWIDTRDI